MNIADVHSGLAALLAGLSVSTPVAAEITRVWPLIPPANVSIVEPTIIMWYDLTETLFEPNGIVRQQYDIRLQLFAHRAESDLDIAAQVASSFLDALVSLLSNHVGLGGDVSVVRGFHGFAPQGGTLAILTWGGADWAGLDLSIPITLTDERPRGF